jgi:hypothetical protein
LAVLLNVENAALGKMLSPVSEYAHTPFPEFTVADAGKSYIGVTVGDVPLLVARENQRRAVPLEPQAEPGDAGPEVVAVQDATLSRSPISQPVRLLKSTSFIRSSFALMPWTFV